MNPALPQISILACISLKEMLSPKAIAGLTLVGLGTIIVQLKRRKSM